MTDKEIIGLLRKQPSSRRSRASYYYELLEEIDGLKTNYTEYMTTAPVDCDEELNRSTSAQIKALPKNIAVFEMIEKRYGSMDAFVTSQPAEGIVRLLSDPSSPYKLTQVREALAWEYIRNVGVDGAKPDTHLKRFLSSHRMGNGRNADCTVDEVLKQVNSLSAETGLSQATIDYLIWTFCASKNFEICSATPHCERCPLREYCNYHGHSSAKDK